MKSGPNGSEKIRKKAIDGAGTSPYMALHRRGRVTAQPRLRLSQRPTGAPAYTGGGTFRLFDIVGLDEGTCGRRPRSPRSSRPRRIGKAKSFHVSLHIHSICEVQERLLEAGLEVREFSLAGAVVGH